MKPESRLDVATRHLAEAEAAVERQKKLIAELHEDGHTTKGADTLLRLLEESLSNAREALASIKEAGRQHRDNRPE